MADAHGLGPCELAREGSSPSARTTRVRKNQRLKKLVALPSRVFEEEKWLQMTADKPHGTIPFC